MTTLRIHVTKDILKASAGCGLYDTHNLEEGDVSTNCAIALAIREVFSTAFVGEDTIYIYDKETWYPGVKIKYKMELPVEAQMFIEEFDSCTSEEKRIAMDPISFNIDVPDALVDEISLDEIKEALKGSTTLELITT